MEPVSLESESAAGISSLTRLPVPCRTNPFTSPSSDCSASFEREATDKAVVYEAALAPLSVVMLCAALALACLWTHCTLPLLC